MLKPDTPLGQGSTHPYYIYLDARIFVLQMPRNRLHRLICRPKVNLRAEQAGIVFMQDCMPVAYVVLLDGYTDYGSGILHDPSFLIKFVYSSIEKASALPYLFSVMPPFLAYTNIVKEEERNAVVNYKEGPEAWAFVFDHLRQNFRI